MARQKRWAPWLNFHGAVAVKVGEPPLPPLLFLVGKIPVDNRDIIDSILSISEMPSFWY
jgi:hypothetical protein